MSVLILLLNYFHILILAHEIIVDISGEDHMALNISIVLFYLRQCGAGGEREASEKQGASMSAPGLEGE